MRSIDEISDEEIGSYWSAFGALAPKTAIVLSAAIHASVPLFAAYAARHMMDDPHPAQLVYSLGVLGLAYLVPKARLMHDVAQSEILFDHRTPATYTATDHGG